MSGKVRGFEVVDGFEGAMLPVRSTGGAAGYDFIAFEDVTIPPMLEYKTSFGPGLAKITRYSSPVLVKTGVCAYMPEGEFIQVVNRSSNPLKRGLVLANGVGVVDSDYYGCEANGGHIMFQFLNFSDKPVTIRRGERIGQGIFMKFSLADGDTNTDSRVGGFGSTGV